jgi:uncharacterized protein
MNSKYYIHRTVESYIFDEELIGRHMVFLAGPRQVGKTELARKWLADKGCSSLYFNWDDLTTRQAYRTDSRFFESSARNLGKQDPWIVFDEIHKRNRWRDILKGAYDLFKDEFRYLVTGSARLDLFRRSGDSLVGRYNLFHMMPLGVREVVGGSFFADPWTDHAFDNRAKMFEEAVSVKTGAEYRSAYERLLQHGPFPEPFLAQSDRFCRKWHNDYISLIVREDLRDISRVTDLDKMESMILLLAPRLMSPLSMPNIAAELEVAHTTIKSWLEQLKRLYLVFPVSPWSKKISRGLRKENKWYYLDWYYAPEGPARLENMVATHLYRLCLAMSDTGYGDYRLHFVRTLDKREIDFLVTKDEVPILAVEVKSGGSDLSRPLRDRLKWFSDPPTIGVQITGDPDCCQKHASNTWLLSADRFLALLV